MPLFHILPVFAFGPADRLKHLRQRQDLLTVRDAVVLLRMPDECVQQFALGERKQIADLNSAWSACGE